MRLVLLLQLTLLLISHQTHQQVVHLPDEIAVCEAVVLAHMEGLSTEHRNSVHYYFNNRKASGSVAFPPEFFEKYKGHAPPFMSSAELKLTDGQLVTLEWSWGFQTPRRIDDDTYVVRGGYYCGGLCAKYCDYRVVRKDGKWIVEAADSCVVS